MEGNRLTAPSYMAWSILNTLFCCLPLGIAAIIYSSKVNSANGAGDWARAADASNTSKKLNIAALVCGLALVIIFVLLNMV